MPTPTSTLVDRLAVPALLAAAVMALAPRASAQVEINADANCSGFVNLTDFSTVTSNLCASRTVVP